MTRKQEVKEMNRILRGISIFICFPFIMAISLFLFVVRMFLLSEIPPQVTQNEFVFFLFISIVYFILSSVSLIFLFKSRAQMLLPGIFFVLISLVWIFSSYNMSSPHSINLIGIIINLVLLLMVTIKFIKWHGFKAEP